MSLVRSFRLLSAGLTPGPLCPPPRLHACKSVHLLSNFKHTDTISLMHLRFLCVEVQIGNDSLLPTALTFMMEHNVKRPTMPLREGGRGRGRHAGD